MSHAPDFVDHADEQRQRRKGSAKDVTGERFHRRGARWFRFAFRYSRPTSPHRLFPHLGGGASPIDHRHDDQTVCQGHS
jgi:hypothetical protein